MENDLNIEKLKESLSIKNENKNINLNLKEEEIKNDINENENSANKIKISNEENNETSENKIELKDKEECSKIEEKVDNEKKINNKRVNNLLKDIYSSMTKINEVNDRVKNILSKRKKMNSVNSFKINFQDNKESKIKNKRKSTTTSKNKINYKIKEKNSQIEYSLSKISNIHKRNMNKNRSNITKNETESVNLKLKTNNNNNIYILSKLDNSSTDNQTRKNNSTFFYKFNTPEQFNRTENAYNKPKYYKYEELKVNDISPNEKNDETSNINNNSGFYEEEYENEKLIRYMKIKLKKEEKKLKVLEEQKNKLLNEEKQRRKVLMEKIRNKNRMKKKCLINEYKTKINLIQKLQTNNINEIRKLEIQKKIDEDNIIKLDKICENININDSSLKSNNGKSDIKNSVVRSKFDNSSDGLNFLFSDNETQNKSSNKKIINSNYCIYSNNYVEKENKSKYNNESEEGLTEEYQFNNSINELTSTCDMNDENYSFSYSQEVKKSSYKRKLNFDDVAKTKKENINPFNYLFNYYQKVNNTNNINNIKNENMNVDNYLNQNTKRKKYNSEIRKYNKSLNNIKPHNVKRNCNGSFTPNQGVLSFIKTKVNKYNHSSNKGTNLSKRLSQMTAYPSSLMSNFNCKYNYKYAPSTVSRTSASKNLSRKNSERNNRPKNKNLKELNFKYIFFNHN